MGMVLIGLGTFAVNNDGGSNLSRSHINTLAHIKFGHQRACHRGAARSLDGVLSGDSHIARPPLQTATPKDRSKANQDRNTFES